MSKKFACRSYSSALYCRKLNKNGFTFFQMSRNMCMICCPSILVQYRKRLKILDFSLTASQEFWTYCYKYSHKNKSIGFQVSMRINQWIHLDLYVLLSYTFQNVKRAITLKCGLFNNNIRANFLFYYLCMKL